MIDTGSRGYLWLLLLFHGWNRSETGKKNKTVCINLDIYTEFMDKNVPKGKLRKTSVPFKGFRTESEALFQLPALCVEQEAAGRQITPAEQLKDTQYKDVECGTPDSEVKYISWKKTAKLVGKLQEIWTDPSAAICVNFLGVTVSNRACYAAEHMTHVCGRIKCCCSSPGTGT